MLLQRIELTKIYLLKYYQEYSFKTVGEESFNNLFPKAALTIRKIKLLLINRKGYNKNETYHYGLLLQKIIL